MCAGCVACQYRNYLSSQMRDLPKNLSPYKRTEMFRQDSIPTGLLHAHSTKAGTWGKIVVLRGRLRYRILEPAVEEILLSPETAGIVEPTVPHEVEPIGEVEFYVEFHRADLA